MTIPLTRGHQEPGAAGDLRAAADATSARNLIVNRDKPPFDNPELRRAMALALDRKAFIDILTEGQGKIGGGDAAAARRASGACRRRCCETLPGYGPDVAKNRAEAREIMEKLGYGPDKRLAVKVSTRNIPPYRDPAVILIDQLKEIYIDAELEPIETDALVSRRCMRKDYTVGAQPDRHRGRRPRRDVLRELRLRRRSATTPATATPRSTS